MFRTPLNVIREYTSLIREGVRGEVNVKQGDFLDVVGYRIDDLNTMVDDMLDSSKLEAGTMGVHRQSVDPASILDRPISGLQLKAKVRGIELLLKADSDLPDVFCDPEKISRVITNLVANAIKFCDDETGLIIVAIEHRTQGHEIEISVSDNGLGIEPDDLGQLFDRFRQMGTSTQSSTKGFGLCLNIAQELVDQSFGAISVESTVDVGTTFRFTVPVDDWRDIVQRFSVRLARDDPQTSVVVVEAEVIGNVDEKSCRDIESFWRFTDRQIVGPQDRRADMDAAH